MAEAHQAVAFSFQVTHEGVHINYDLELFHVVWLSGMRAYKKRFTRFLNDIKNCAFPSSIEFLVIILALITVFYFVFNLDISFGFINYLKNHLLTPFFSPKLNNFTITVIACSIYGLLVWFGKTMIMRYTLKTLLLYKGWVFEQRGKVSTFSKIWFYIMKSFKIKKPLLYSYQSSLPRLPVPSINETIERYLKSIKPLCENEEEYQKKVNLALEFKNGISRHLQIYLIIKSWWASNYVSDWWEEYVYLRGRSPIMINSNFYGIDAILACPTSKQTSRAANLVYSCLIFRRLIDRQELSPIMTQNLVPLCSWQYERTFNTTRIPGVETDKLVHYNDSQHIVVICKGKYYKITIYYKGRLLLPKAIEKMLDQIVEDESPTSFEEEHLGVLTAIDRITWAKAREEHFSKGINKISLEAIEKAAFVLCLDDEKFEFDENDPKKLDRYGQTLLHGKGYNRWFDKSFNLIVGANGQAGFNAEHSWADAPIIAHLWEFIIATDFVNLGYNEKGRCEFGNGIEPFSPIRLKWNFSKKFHTSLEDYVTTAQALVNDVDLKLIMFKDYGKGFIKKCKLSPDAFIQMALQLAYYRYNKKICLTYEACMTRFFREGRTETVRPVTIESEKWLRAMEDENASDKKRISLLKIACETHQKSYRYAMCGKGIDRHLFCLYVISKYLELDSPFLKEVLSEPWKLSTSQTPHGQAGLVDLKKYPNCMSAGGGFGPVADDGYGVSYIIAGEDVIFFHISSKISSSKTDSLKFAKLLIKVLKDMKQLVELDC